MMFFKPGIYLQSGKNQYYIKQQNFTSLQKYKSKWHKNMRVVNTHKKIYLHRIEQVTELLYCLE